MKAFLFAISVIFFAQSVLARPPCVDLLTDANGDIERGSSTPISLDTQEVQKLELNIEKETAVCRPKCSWAALSRDTSNALQKILKSRGIRRTLGYSILIATAVTGIVVSSHLISMLPQGSLSMELAAISGILVGSFLSPITDPSTSIIRKLSMLMATEPKEEKRAQAGNASDQEHLIQTWYEMNRKYDLRQLMAKEDLRQFIYDLKFDFIVAYMASKFGDENFGAAQIANTAFNMRGLSKEISPSDPYVTKMIQSSFTDHYAVTPQFVELVWSFIKKDPDWNSPDGLAFYNATLTTWFGDKNKNQSVVGERVSGN